MLATGKQMEAARLQAVAETFVWNIRRAEMFLRQAEQVEQMAAARKQAQEARQAEEAARMAAMKKAYEARRAAIAKRQDKAKKAAEAKRRLTPRSPPLPRMSTPLCNRLRKKNSLPS